MSIKNYAVRHMQAALYSLGQISRVPLASFMTCLVIGIALSMPAILFVGLKNFKQVTQNLQNTMQITLYLKSSTNDKDVKKVTEELKNNKNISHVELVSPAQGLLELQQQAGFHKALIELPNNPLPWVIIILPDSIKSFNALTTSLQKLPAVESIQYDQLWTQRLANLISLLQRGTYALTLFLGLAVFLIINNTIRSATQQNAKEIHLIKLIGGTHAFIRRPFLYAGMIYGLFGAIIAWQLVDILSVILRKPLYRLTDLYDNSYQLLGLDFYNTFILLVLGILIGWFGSWLAVTRYLKNC